MGCFIESIRLRNRGNLQQHGTDVDYNDRDVTGDGDQSPVQPACPDDEQDRYYRSLWTSCSDIPYSLHFRFSFSPFATMCFLGNVSMIRRMLKDADTDPKHPSSQLIQLLETRETSMRLSPILMLVSIVEQYEYKSKPKDTLQFVEVAKLLLKYGARPNAKDVVGKTVVHYGMGIMASNFTIDIAGLCVEANRSSHLFNQEVELHGLNTVSMNGKRGIARGYMDGRRAVYVCANRREVWIKPENLRLVVAGDASVTTPTNLVDVPDRLGLVALHEWMAGEATPVMQDAYMKLMIDYHARTDIVPHSGVIPKPIVLDDRCYCRSINKALMEQVQEEPKAKVNKCRTCGTTSVPLSDCAGCRAVAYCSRECQLKDWKERHKKECKVLGLGV